MIVDIQTRVRKLKRDLQLSRKPDYREQLRTAPGGCRTPEFQEMHSALLFLLVGRGILTCSASEAGGRGRVGIGGSQCNGDVC